MQKVDVNGLESEARGKEGQDMARQDVGGYWPTGMIEVLSMSVVLQIY